MAKAKKILFKLPFKKITALSLAVILFLVLIISTFYAAMLDKIYPAVYIAGTSVSFLNQNEAKNKLESSLTARLNQTLEFKYLPQNSTLAQTYQIKLDPNSFNLKSDQAISEAFQYGHQKMYKSKVNLNLEASINPSLDSQIEKIAQTIEVPPLDSNLKVIEGEITVSPSQDGLKLDQAELKERLLEYLNTETLSDNSLPVKVNPPELSYDQALEIKKRLDQIKLSPLKLTFEDLTFTLDLNQILSLIDLQNTKSSLVSTSLFDKPISIEEAKIGDTDYQDTKLTLNGQKLTDYLSNIKSQIDRPVQEPLFNIEQTGDPNKPKIKEFRPPLEGRELNLKLAEEKISQALLTQNQTEVKLPVSVVEPKNKLTNELGIKELVARGISNFAGSIPNRIFNIGLAASRINGILIPPGEEFSFVRTVGDITAQTGYKQAYVIKSGRTVLDDGGGVCQVSTTVFRAALNSGLPITSRTAHAYRVGYYEQGYPPGLDATVFYPSVDFKFKNDTTQHILIQAYTEGLNLYVDLYGTSDGRVATLTKPVITGQTPPPPELRQDDPTLPAGTVKQVDFAAWGANVVFKRTVTKNGQVIIDESFSSRFRPWQAIFLVGTKTT